MYLGPVLIVLAVICLIVGIASGGAFTIVLVPLAVIAVVGAVVALVTARAAGIEPTLTEQPKHQETGRSPRGTGAPAGEVPATPDEFIEARQKSQ